MEFTIIILLGNRRFRMKVKQIYKSSEIEKYEVTGGKRSVILRNNIPLLRSKGLKKKRPDWKIEEGDFRNAQGLALTIEAIENELKRLENTD